MMGIGNERKGKEWKGEGDGGKKGKDMVCT